MKRPVPTHVGTKDAPLRRLRDFAADLLRWTGSAERILERPVRLPDGTEYVEVAGTGEGSYRAAWPRLERARAYSSSGGSPSSSTWVPIPVDTVDYDTALWWDAASSGFKPTVAGYYSVACRAKMSTAGRLIVGVGIDGTEVKASGADVGSGRASAGSCLVYLDGNQTVQGFLWQSGGGTVQTGTFDTWLEVYGPLP